MVYLVVLTWIIVFKMCFSFQELPQIREINVIPFAASAMVNGGMNWSEVIDNVIVFIPFGAYLSLFQDGRPSWRSFWMILGLSAIFEAIQFILGIGVTDITDLMTNTSGGVIGMYLVCGVSSLLKEKTTKILNGVALVCTILMVGLLGTVVIVNL